MTANVLVVGDVMLDTYVVGRSDRLSPEAPVPVVAVTGEFDHLGGAANVARQVAALGGRVRLVGVVGADAVAERVTAHCTRLGVDVSGLVVDTGRPTTSKQRVMVGRQQIARLDRELASPVEGAVEAAVVESVAAAFAATPAPDIVIVSDYAKGVVTDAVLAAVRSGATAASLRVLVDPKDPHVGRYRGSHVLKTNLAEFEAAADRRADGDPVALVSSAGPGLVAGSGIDHLVVTLGAGGLVVVPNGGTPTHVESERRDVFDVSGAGDTVIATLAVRLVAGDDLLSAAVTANLAGGLAVERPGVSVIGAGELAAARAGGAGNVVDRDRLLERRERWRQEGRSVVMTNGCFDLLHAGHVHLLTRAASHGDVLVVAVDSDRSVRTLKGDGRPLIGEAERLAVVGALAAVDAVVLFETEELESLIEAVAPDVLVKGADYRVEDVVGAPAVLGAGGRVELVPLLGQHSTSALVDKIRDA